MKFAQLSVLSLITILLLTLQSCQKDTLSDSDSYTIENRTRDYGVYNSYAASRPVPTEYPILANFPQGYWEISEVAAAAIKYDEIFKKLKDVQQYGFPVWAATIIRSDSVRSLSITPLLDSEDELINFYIFEKHLVTENSRFLFVYKNNNLPGFNQNGFFDDFNVFERRKYNINQQGCYNWGSSGGFLNKLFGWVGGLFDGIGSVNPPAGMGTIYIPWIPLDAPGSFGTQTNGSTFGGASGNNGYTYPNGGIGNSDLRVKTAQGCKDFIEKSWGISVQTTNLQEKIDKCGCTRAVFMNSEYWNVNQNNGKLSCLACYNTLFASHYVSQLVDIFKNIKFPCQQVSEADKSKMIDDALGDICERNYYNSDIYPGVILQRFTNELNNKDLTYYAPSSYLSGPMNALALASLDIVKMGVILGINQQGVKQLSEESICAKLKVAECLEGGMEDPGGLLHPGKKAVLDFYKAHNPLKHPCSYAELNLDNTVLQMCASNSMSMDNLEAMLEGESMIFLQNAVLDEWFSEYQNDPDAIVIRDIARSNLCAGTQTGYGNDFFTGDPGSYILQRLVFLAIKAEYKRNHPGANCDWKCEIKLWYKAAYNVLKDPVHIGLDICGLIPGAGELCDGINGVIYTLEGDGINASISFAAMVPIGGWIVIAGKHVGILVKTASGKTITLPLKLIGNIVDFGNRGDLRKVLELPVDDPRQAHHLISWSEKGHDVIQAAAKGSPNATTVFHMNHPANGLAVDAWRQAARQGEQAGHLIYNSRVKAGLDEIERVYGIDNPELLLRELNKFENYLRNIINANPNLHLNDIVFEYVL